MILDHTGRPMERQALREPQTSHLGHLHGEFDNHPSRGLTPPKLARILQAAEQGDLLAQHELFQDMEEKDGHLFSVMQTRRLALQELSWDVAAPEDATPAEEELAAFVKDALLGIEDFEDLVFDLTDGIGHGFAALELEWADRDRAKLPVRATHRPQTWFKHSTMPGVDRNELRLRDNSADGAPLWSFGWIVHRHKSRSGYASRRGLFRVLAWPFLFKNYGVRDLAEFLEVYGMPLRLGTYSPAASKEDKATLLRAVVGMGHDAAAIIPEGMMIDFKEAASGDDKPFSYMVSLMERTMSKAVLGGTLTSGEGENGTQALGKVHNELRKDIRNADAKQLAATINTQLIYPLLAVNRGVTDMRRCPRLVFDTQEPEDVKLFADSIPKLVGVGMRIPRGWAHEVLKIPQADQGDQDVLVAPAPAPATGAAGGTGAPGQGSPAEQDAARNKLKLAALRQVPTADADELDTLAWEMLGEWEETFGAELQGAIEKALEAATSFDDFSQALETALADVAPERLVDLMARGAFAARIWGRLNAAKRPSAEK